MMIRTVQTFILLILCTDATVRSKVVLNLTQVTWEDGRFGYFAVPRERVAAKLAEVHQHDSCHKERLTLPKRTILPDILGPDQHVVAIVYGKLGAKSIEDSLPADVKANYETKADTVQFFIPFLTGSDPDAEPKYKLALTSFVSTAKPFIQPNIAIPTEQVDLLNVRSDGLTIVDADVGVLDITWPELRECDVPDEVIVHDFDEYIDEFTLSFKRNPDYPFCDEPDAGESIVCEYQETADCACQFWTHGQTKICKATSFSVTDITEKFKNVSLLTDGPQDAVLTEINEGLYGIGVQMSCIN